MEKSTSHVKQQKRGGSVTVLSEFLEFYLNRFYLLDAEVADA
jgi:hypothetical protein